MRGLSLVFILGIICSGCAGWYFHPSKEEAPVYRDGHLIDHHEITVASDSRILHSVYVHASNPKKLFVYFHGNAGNITTHLPALYWLLNHNFDIYTFDYSGFGRSTGYANFENAIIDSKAALKKALQFAGEKKISEVVVMGSSMGGHLLLHALRDYWASAKISHVVLDSTFCSLKTEVQHVLSQSLLFMAVFPVILPIVAFQPNLAESCDVLNELTIPTIILHDWQDTVVGSTNAREIMQNTKNIKAVLGLNVGLHANMLSIYEVREWLMAQLQTKL